MDKILLQYILFMALLTHSSYAQDKGCVYNKLTNSAELHIVDGKYGLALKKYDKAFGTGIDFTVDLYNACACADKLNKVDKVYKYSKILAMKAVGDKFFNRGIFGKYKKDKNFAAILKLAAEKKIEIDSKNLSYNEKLKKIVTNDSLYNALRLNKYKDSYPMPDTLRKLFTQNTEKLIHLIKSEGYYSESKVGAKIFGDTLSTFFSRPDIVFLHYLGDGNNDSIINDIKGIVIENMKAGMVKPYQISTIIQYNEEIFGDIGLSNYNLHDCKIYGRKSILDNDRVNFYRELYCLDNLKEYEKKIAFTYSKKTSFDFKYNVVETPVHDMQYFMSIHQAIASIYNCSQK